MLPTDENSVYRWILALMIIYLIVAYVVRYFKHKKIADEDPGARDSGNVGNARGPRAGRNGGSGNRTQTESCRERLVVGNSHHGAVASDSAADLEYVLGADGKARRVEPGIRLLVDGFPSRVGLLRGFGNAIDPRPAAAFITAAMQASLEYRNG